MVIDIDKYSVDKEDSYWGLKDRISKRKSKSYSCMAKAKSSPEEAKKLLLMVPELKARSNSDNYVL